MPDSVKLLDYKGEVDHRKIDQLLKRLKKSDSYISLDKTTAKRVYSILVECLENISKHSEKSITSDSEDQPYILVTRTMTKVMIRTGNPVSESKALQLCNRLDHINQVDDTELNRLYDDMINKKTDRNGNGAGLGFMLMKFKSGNPIEYSLYKTDGELLFFEFRIKVNKYIMRKLLIEPTVSSPKVILDPEKNWFEISGESRPADVATFYEEIISWMDDYSHHLGKSIDSKEPLTFNLDFEYFNSSSAKYILDFCKQIGDVRAIGRDVHVRWLYDEDDMDMLEVGREMSRMVKFPFEYISKEIK
ncbi:MAG TPA: SiaB family protein kinase [Bacteroidales bacterium]|nr:SiaB family protein kinase [Bacteroidales bacterium]